MSESSSLEALLNIKPKRSLERGTPHVPTSTPQPTALFFQDEEGRQHRLDTGPEGMIVADGYLHLRIGSNPQEWAAFPILPSSTFLPIREVLTGGASRRERGIREEP